MMLTTELLTALRDERIDFGEFIRLTQDDFRAMVNKIINGWGAMPPAVEVQDLQQEMLLAVHTGLQAYEYDRGDLRTFIVWRICSEARKMLHRQTKIKNRDAVGPTLLEVQDSEQEVVYLAQQRTARLPTNERQAAIIGSLLHTGSVDETANELLSDLDTQRLFMPSIRRRIKKVSQQGRRQARYSVYRTARRLALRAQNA